jgi:predicted phage terminase large subunit-like protein
MDAGAIVSWPSVRSLYWLMRQRAVSKRAFNTEMQGDPLSDEDKVFSKYTFWVQRLLDWIMFGACDPSMGKGETSDPSAILIGGYDARMKRLHVIEAAIKRRVPSKLSSDLIDVQREFRCRAFAFENNNAYEHMRQTFITDALGVGIALPLVGVTATVAPEVRIDGLEPFVTDETFARIVFHAKLTQLLSELDTWPAPQTNHHYDGLTALHLLWHIAITRGAGLYASESVGRRGQGSDDYSSHSRSMF